MRSTGDSSHVLALALVTLFVGAGCASTAGVQPTVTAEVAALGSWTNVTRITPRTEVIVRLGRGSWDGQYFVDELGTSTYLSSNWAWEARGFLLSAGPEGLVLDLQEPRKGTLTVRREAVRSLDLVGSSRRDTPVEGLVWGGAIGFGVGALGFGHHEDIQAAPCGMISAAIGATIGFFADLARDTTPKERVYEASPRLPEGDLRRQTNRPSPGRGGRRR